VGIEHEKQFSGRYNESSGWKHKGEGPESEVVGRYEDYHGVQISRPQKRASYGVKHFVLPPPKQSLNESGRRVSEGMNRDVPTSSWV
jgi:hypothetical protein